MRKRTMKATAMAILTSGFLFQFGCLPLGGLISAFASNAPIWIGMEWVADNDAVFDLFEDGNVGE